MSMSLSLHGHSKCNTMWKGPRGIFLYKRQIITSRCMPRNVSFAILRTSLHWRHNDHDGFSNHQPHGCLRNRLFRRRSKKTSKLCVTGLCVGNSPGPVNSPHKGPVTRKMFPFDDVIMIIEILWISIICAQHGEWRVIELSETHIFSRRPVVAFENATPIIRIWRWNFIDVVFVIPGSHENVCILE